MTLTLELAPDEGLLLETQAQDAGLSPQDYARRVLLGDKAEVARRLKQRRGIALLQSWLDEAKATLQPQAREANEEWRASMGDLDEHRGGRRLFGEEEA